MAVRCPSVIRYLELGGALETRGMLLQARPLRVPLVFFMFTHTPSVWWGWTR
jgi:hypothetical protein